LLPFFFYFGCKVSAKFRFSEEKANLFAFLSVRNLSKIGEKTQKKQKEAEITPYFFLFFTNLPYERQRITFRDAHQKPLTSCGP